MDALMMRLDKDRDGSVDISEFFERMGQLKTDLAQRLKEELALAQLKEQRGVLREPSLDQIKLMEVPELQGLMERRAAKVHEEEQRQAAVRRAKDLQGMGVPVRDALLGGGTVLPRRVRRRDLGALNSSTQTPLAAHAVARHDCDEAALDADAHSRRGVAGGEPDTRARASWQRRRREESGGPRLVPPKPKDNDAAAENEAAQSFARYNEVGFEDSRAWHERLSIAPSRIDLESMQYSGDASGLSMLRDMSHSQSDSGPCSPDPGLASQFVPRALFNATDQPSGHSMAAVRALIALFKRADS